MTTAVVIDDMQSAREVITSIIGRHCKQVKVVGEADGVQSGINLIKQQKPTLVILDIQMRDGTGFDLLNKLKPFDFKVIFISAYETHALKAFKFSALDYILKPIDSDELVAAIEKSGEVLPQQGIAKNLDILENNYSSSNKDSKKIILRTSDRIYAISLKDIIRCESEANYTRFFLNDGRKIIISKPLKEYDDMLSDFGFFRTHQSHLINLDYFEHYKKADGGYAVLKDSSVIPVSSRKKNLFLETIDAL